MPVCDMCGRKVSYLKRAKIEGAVLDVCDGCSHMGEIIREPDFVERRGRSQREVKISTEEIVPGFGKLISSARQKKEWDVKKLAEMLHAKESLMHKIESGKIKPRMDLAKKIEHTLGIKIVRESTDEEVEVKKANGNGMTIGDFITVKVKKKKEE